MQAIDEFARWLTSDAALKTDRAVAAAKRVILDTVGCLIAGSGHPATRKTLAAVSVWGRGPASVPGEPEGLPVPWAALVNGTAMHALDFNAWTPPTCSFSPSVILAALFPLAETGGKSGADVLDALIAGLEISMRLGEALNPGHYCGGWHTTATIDTIGAAAACSRLTGLNGAGFSGCEAAGCEGDG